VRLEEFKKQIAYLQQNFQIISMNDVEEYLEGKKKIIKPSVVITFDDGYKNVLETKEFLKNNTISPTLFAIADSDNANRAELETNLPFLSNSDLEGLIKNAWELGSHSLTHPNFKNMDTDEIKREIYNSKKVLEKTLGTKIKYIAYPKGKYDKAILKEVADSGYELGLSMDDALISPSTNRFIIPRVGIDGSHSFTEFKATIRPTAILFRGVVKKFLS
jgi:peptidoglycan/xylan/chitin deacetylase (PgdA/CDA1 family)